MKMRYFDNSATTPVRQEVLEAMLPYLKEQFGNPSSLYSIGRSGKKAIEEARRQVAMLINANPHDIYFTGCGSESDNMAIKGAAHYYRHRGKHIITSKIEHPAVLNSCKSLAKQGFEITYLNIT